MNSCTVCKKNLTKVREPGIQCSGPCKLFYHDKCASISREEFDVLEKEKLVFICPNCKKTQRKSIIIPRNTTPNRETLIKEKSDKNQIEEQNKEFNSRRQDIEAIKDAQNEINKSVLVLTDLVNDVKEKVNLCNTILDAVNALSEKVEKIERKLNANEENKSVEKPTLSEIIRNNTEYPVFRAIPKDKTQKGEQTTTEIQGALNPSTSKVTNFKQVSSGAVFISCIDQTSVQKCIEEATKKLGDRYDINIPRKKTPQIKIVGISDDIVTMEDLFEKIRSQNEIIEQTSKFNLINIRKNNRGSNIAIIETDENTHDIIVRNGRLNIGWRRCQAFEFINVARCFRCQKYNHVAKYCDKNNRCGVCSEEHETAKCENNTIQVCANCSDAKKKYNVDIDVNHCAWDLECPVYKRNIESEKKKLRFYN